jgi:hypothetical protein
MADDEFNIEELISGPEESHEDVAESNTRNTRNANNTSTSPHPFSVRLDQEYVTLIKAVAWWKRMSQREFMEQAVETWLETNEEDLPAIID